MTFPTNLPTKQLRKPAPLAVGIDGGDNTGIAIRDPETGRIAVVTVAPHDAVETCQRLPVLFGEPDRDVIIYLEDPRSASFAWNAMNVKSSKAAQMKAAQDLGKCKQSTRMIADGLTSAGIRVVLVPLCRRQRAKPTDDVRFLNLPTKISAGQLQSLIPGSHCRTNEHERDALTLIIHLQPSQLRRDFKGSLLDKEDNRKPVEYKLKSLLNRSSRTQSASFYVPHKSARSLTSKI